MTPKQRLDGLIALGFDTSYKFDKSGRSIAVQCSQCQAAVIDGTPAHETGCSNEMHECKGCAEMISAGFTYCSECTS